MKCNSVFYQIETSRMIYWANQMTRFHMMGTLWQGNPFKQSTTFHIKTSPLIRSANQMNGFYMKCDDGLKWVKEIIHTCFTHFLPIFNVVEGFIHLVRL